MASKPLFTILCASATVTGFLTFIFGLIDIIGIKMQISFLMLPLWNGILFGSAGAAGLIIGRQNKKQGSASSGMTSGLKALNVLCFSLSLLTFYMYGSVVMYLGFRDVVVSDASNRFANYDPDYVPTTRPPIALPTLQSTMNGTTDDDTRQGVFAMILIFSLVEMLMSAWIFMLEKEQMMLWSSTGSDQVPLFTSEGIQYIQQDQSAQPHAGMMVNAPPQPQQQQLVYMAAPGQNAPLVAGAVRQQQQQQQQQQPRYVVLHQPSAVMATSQPQGIQRPQPQYVVLQNEQVPRASPPAQREIEEVRTDSPAPQAGDIRLMDTSSSGVA